MTGGAEPQPFRTVETMRLGLRDSNHGNDKWKEA